MDSGGELDGEQGEKERRESREEVATRHEGERDEKRVEREETDCSMVF